MIVIPLPDPIDHHALALAKMVAATSWLPSANVVRAADENLSQDRQDLIPIRLHAPNSAMIGRWSLNFGLAPKISFCKPTSHDCNLSARLFVTNR